MNTSKQYVIGGVIFIAFVGFLFAISGNKASSPSDDTSGIIPSANAQMIELTAKAGYFPKTQTAKANTPTTLRVKTNSTFDCSSAFAIPSLGIRKNLPPNGNTDIAIPPQAPGTKLAGTCGMGMYRFDVEFQ